MRTDLEAEGHPMTMLMDGPSQTMKMLMAEQKMVHEHGPQGDARRRKRSKKHTPPKITALGTRRRRSRAAPARTTCVETGELETMEICDCQGLGYFMMARSPMGGGARYGTHRAG